MIRAMLFDLDDTLYDYTEMHEGAMCVLEQYACDTFGISKLLFREAFTWAREETKRGLNDVAAGHNRMLYCQKFLEYIGLNPVCGSLELYEVYWRYFLDNMVLREGAEEILSFCKNKGIKIGIGTDLTAHIQHRKIRALKIEPYIDALVTSEESGKEKPDSQLFEMLLKKIKVSKNEAIYVGDNLEKDVKGAECAGIHPIWFSSSVHEQYESINNLQQLVSVVEREYEKKWD